jgi:hypothetical protein
LSTRSSTRFYPLWTWHSCRVFVFVFKQALARMDLTSLFRFQNSALDSESEALTFALSFALPWCTCRDALALQKTCRDMRIIGRDVRWTTLHTLCASSTELEDISAAFPHIKTLCLVCRVERVEELHVQMFEPLKTLKNLEVLHINAVSSRVASAVAHALKAQTSPQLREFGCGLKDPSCRFVAKSLQQLGCALATHPRVDIVKITTDPMEWSDSFTRNALSHLCVELAKSSTLKCVHVASEYFHELDGAVAHFLRDTRTSTSTRTKTSVLQAIILVLIGSFSRQDVHEFSTSLCLRWNGTRNIVRLTSRAKCAHESCESCESCES